MMLGLGLTRDVRLTGWSFMDSPVGLVSVCALYLLVVLKVGPQFMQQRKPFNIKMLVRAFNLMQVLSNLYFVSYGVYLAFYKGGYRLLCEPLHRRTDPDSLQLVRLYHFYFMVRLSDLIDTVFFVLAKKQSHVTFLHVYHHLCVILNGWIGLRHGWINGVLLGIFMNASIHVVMYSYFLLATFPEMKRHLWWKRYITVAQICQFLVFSALAVVVIHKGEACGYPKAAIVNGCVNIVLLLMLFSKFYVDTYVRKAAIERPHSQ